MKTLVLQQPGELVWEDRHAAVPRADEALVRVVSCGVCGTDIHALAGKQPFFSYPRVLGHELCVEILEAPAASGLEPGTLCAVEPYHFCGACPPCLAGRTNTCHHLQVLGVHTDGGHTPRMALPVDKLHPAPGLTSDQIALVEPLAIGAHAVTRANPRSGEPTVVIGMGPIGLAVALSAKAAGANLAVVDVDAARLAFATETLGLGIGFTAGENLGDQLRAHFGQFPSCVIDATGNRHSMNHCFTFTEHGGRVVFVGLFIGNLEIDDPNFHRRELTLLASRAALPQTFRDLIALIRSGSLRPDALITHRIPFASLAGELPEIHRKPGLVKAIIDY